MLERSSIGEIALGDALHDGDSARAAEDARYPELRASGESGGAMGCEQDRGRAGTAGAFDGTMQAIYNAAWRAAATPAQEYNPQVRCIPPVMPRAMIDNEPIESW